MDFFFKLIFFYNYMFIKNYFKKNLLYKLEFNNLPIEMDVFMHKNYTLLNSKELEYYYYFQTVKATFFNWYSLKLFK